MSRAFILLQHERRKTERTVTLPPREIPVRDARDDAVSKPLVTTTGKVIGWLLILLTAVITVEGWLYSNRFETIVEKHFSEFELKLVREYATKNDTMSKREYDLRHAELIEQDRQLADRIGAAERRLDAVSERLILLERKH